MKHKTYKDNIVITGLDSDGIPDDENPEWTAADFKKAKRFKDLPKELQVGLLALKKSGRPKSARPKKPISFRFSADIVEHLKEDVVGYNARVEAMLREAIEQGRI